MSKNVKGSDLAKALGDLSPSKVIKEVAKQGIPSTQHGDKLKK